MTDTKRKTKTVNKVTRQQEDGWLTVSTEGFAEQNVARPPGHLVKELVQNAFDAIDGKPGTVSLTIQKAGKEVNIICTDDGCGIEDLDNIRTVFWTSKQDSVLNRGRMGRGFKEALCLATNCMVISKGKCIHFVIDNGDERKVVNGIMPGKIYPGTTVKMNMPWSHAEIPKLAEYFVTFLPPANIDFYINGIKIDHRRPKHVVPATLTTEKWEDGRWIKAQRTTEVHLVPILNGEQPTIYEMGIPVTDAEWDRPYHVDVQQRVPMNPNRDAVATGFPQKLHKVGLPILKDEMDHEALTQEWVSEVLPDMPEDVKRDVISRGFGDGAVRSVPNMGGKRDYDADAEEGGHKIVNTRHLPAGFRQVFNEIIPSSKDAVELREEEEVRLAAESSFDPADAFKAATKKHKQQQNLVNKVGGLDRVNAVRAFAKWFCNQLLNPDGDTCNAVNVALLRGGEGVKGGKPAGATWSDRNTLTLGLDSLDIWTQTFGEYTLRLLIHESAHSRAMHHGRDFAKEVERLSGRAAKVMFESSDRIRKEWKSLLT